jgi:hypothetical protein
MTAHTGSTFADAGSAIRRRHRMRRVRVLGLSAAAVLAVAAGTVATPASADSPNWSRTISDSALAPFQLAVDHQWVYVADGFTGTVTRFKGSRSETVVAAPGEVAAVDLSPDGRSMAYTLAGEDGTSLVIQSRGKPDVVADLSGYEESENPDGGVTYGFVDGTPTDCLTAFDTVLGPMGAVSRYDGVVDSHPYAVAWLGGGAWAVADAGGNDILRVDPDGSVSTLAVLPVQPHTLTGDQAGLFGIPECADQVYRFEPVPTDVENERGSLWVSTLPGGDEQGLLGDRGSVYRVDAASGAATEVASGFGGATNVAVAPNGTLYVSEFFGGGVTEVRGGHHRTVVELTAPIGLEVQGAYLYVGTLADIDFSAEPPSVDAFGSVLRVKR